MTAIAPSPTAEATRSANSPEPCAAHGIDQNWKRT